MAKKKVPLVMAIKRGANASRIFDRLKKNKKGILTEKTLAKFIKKKFPRMKDNLIESITDDVASIDGYYGITK